MLYLPNEGAKRQPNNKQQGTREEEHQVISLLLCSYQSCTILDTNGIIKHYGYAWKCGEESIGIDPLETNTSTSWLMVVKCPTTFDKQSDECDKDHRLRRLAQGIAFRDTLVKPAYLK